MTSNPFAVIFVFTAILLVTSAAFGVAAPTFGIDTPDPPVFPNYPDFTVRGNFSETWAFNETHNVGIGQVTFESFSPDKRYDLWTTGHVVIERYGTWSIIPWWYNEPISYVNGTVINSDDLGYSNLTPQLIANNFNGEYSTFIVDPGHPEYLAYASFFALEGYETMVSSWNEGHGFQLMIYGNSFANADWTVQIVEYLGFFGSVIQYFVYFIAYMVQVASVMLTTLGLIPEISSGIIVLTIIVFIGSLLIFIRGSGSGIK